MAKWEQLMEEDSTLQDYVARYETGEATADDFHRLAADSMINGNFRDAAEYVMQSVNESPGIKDLAGAINAVHRYAGAAISDGAKDALLSRVDELAQDRDETSGPGM